MLYSKGRFISIGNNKPTKLPDFLASDLPDVAVYKGAWVYVIDEGKPAWSDGAAWIRVGTGSGGGAEFSGAKVKMGNVLPVEVPTATEFFPPWETVVFDDGGWFNATNDSFVIPAGVTKVRLAAFIAVGTFGVAMPRYMYFYKNISDVVGYIDEETRASGDTYLHLDELLTCVQGDVFRVVVQQDSGSTVNLGQDYSSFSIQKLE